MVGAGLGEAGARLDDGATGWWLRIVVPCILVAIAVLAVPATVGVQLGDPG